MVYSDRKDSTGFARADCMAWKEMVSNATNSAAMPANPNIHHDKSILKANPFSH